MAPLFLIYLFYVFVIVANNDFSCSDDSCSVLCGTAHLCIDTTINCPPNVSCNVTCNLNSCKNLTIIATHSSSLYLYTYDLETSAFNIYSPLSSNSTPNTFIHKLSSIAHKNENINLRYLPPLQIYAINGFNHITVYEATTPLNYQSFPAIMHCQSGYSSHCKFSTATWSCIDAENICNKPPLPTKQITRRHLLATERVIATIWNDDYVFGSPGWATTQSPVSTVSSATATTYHGPYNNADSNANTFEQFNISQEFYCAKYSTVDIWYKMAVCGTENGDRVNLYLNGILAQSTAGDVGGSQLNDADLIAICQENNPGLQWRQIAYGPLSISEVQMHELFKVHFQFLVTHYNDELVVWDVRIICNPLATTIDVAVPWDEDAILGTLPGWTVVPVPAKFTIPATGSGGGANLRFHGPYNGDSDAGTIEQYLISRQFYCSQTASVAVTYCSATCGTTDAADNVQLYLDDVAQVSSTLTADEANLGPFTNTDLSAAAGGCNTWYYQCLGAGLNGISLVPFNALFKVDFEVNVNLNTEWLTIVAIQITCTANPTVDPTTDPTISPTQNPTRNPTQTPSKYPTISPTQIPTANPSQNPSESPSRHPTRNPTQITLNPSQTPTETPVVAPTQSPTKNPAMSPTIHPSDNPSFSPSGSTLSPSESPINNPSTAPVTSAPTQSSINPTTMPTLSPTTTISPTSIPICGVSCPPTDIPTESPTATPTITTTRNPTQSTTKQPTVACFDWEMKIEFTLLRFVEVDNWRQLLQRLCLQSFKETVILLSAHISVWNAVDWCVNIEVEFEFIPGGVRRLLLQNTVDIGIKETFTINNMLYDAYFDGYNATMFTIEYQRILAALIGQKVNEIDIGELVNVDDESANITPEPTHSPQTWQTKSSEDGIGLLVAVLFTVFGAICCGVMCVTCRLFYKYETKHEDKMDTNYNGSYEVFLSSSSLPNTPIADMEVADLERHAQFACSVEMQRRDSKKTMEISAVSEDAEITRKYSEFEMALNDNIFATSLLMDNIINDIVSDDEAEDTQTQLTDDDDIINDIIDVEMENYVKTIR